MWDERIPLEYRNQIVTGDARELTKRIPDESIDLIFTDPVYDRIEDYKWLAKEAKRILKQDRWCIVYYGIGYLPATVQALSKYLTYEWQHISYMPTLNRRGAYMTFSNYRGFLRYMKGRAIPNKHIRDLYVDTYKSQNDGFKWTKHMGLITHHVDIFSLKDAVIFDPYAGGGTVPAVCKILGRNYIAFEIDPDTAELARERVQNTQPPLFVLEPEQQEMDLG